VKYYPLAGWLGLSLEGKLNVHCNVEGVIFVEAEADCPLEKIGDLNQADPIMLGNLVYSLPSAKNILEIPPLLAQVSVKILQFPLVCLRSITFWED
jgi:omega-hydroxypalmitate O-feruloyl transferase